jgi:hypothetical protein
VSLESSVCSFLSCSPFFRSKHVVLDPLNVDIMPVFLITVVDCIFSSFYSVFAQCLPKGQEAELAGFL